MAAGGKHLGGAGAKAECAWWISGRVSELDGTRSWGAWRCPPTEKPSVGSQGGSDEALGF